MADSFLSTMLESDDQFHPSSRMGTSDKNMDNLTERVSVWTFLFANLPFAEAT